MAAIHNSRVTSRPSGLNAGIIGRVGEWTIG